MGEGGEGDVGEGEGEGEEEREEARRGLPHLKRADARFRVYVSRFRVWG